MSYLVIRTIGLILLTIIVTIMWIDHKKKRTLFIKIKPTTENQKKKYKKWEKRLDVLSFTGVLIGWAVLAIPCCLDLPCLVTGDLREVSGVVTAGAMAGESKEILRTISVQDDNSREKVSFKVYDTGINLGEKIKARYLPNTKVGYIIERE